MDWGNFFAMGGYAAFVWPSYGIAALLLAINAIVPWRRERALRARLRDRQPGARS
ncbi:MAG: heme exporter protein CcmD [Halofilum sp. (in: g-proteobacteria)]|nr:heme exporter protein CcmD [Halofilum sp. (in: g-proteobacteria)]